jgi:glycosyltransferase involved in cell wall biosynthesis
MPKFSFVIPCYKSEMTISNCLGSIFDQDFKDFEVICVLDGPNDDLEEMIRVFKDVKIYKPDHGGACNARNHGLGHARGEYVIFSDSDMYWKPGILRTFSETLDKTGADFAYGGYRFTNYQGGHVPMDFDPYLFTVFNYVDGANPVRTDLVRKIGGWDTGLQRFQDWDLWIRLTKSGAIGVNIGDIAKDTDYPEKNSISGKDNYEKSYFEVRKKNNLPDNRVCVTSIAAPQHALRVAKLCGWDFWPNPSMLPKDYDAIYIFGFFVEGIDDHVKLLTKFGGGARDSKYLIHWIGTDIFNILIKFPYLHVRKIRRMLDRKDLKHFCQSNENKLEMTEMGFKVECLPLPVELTTDEVPFPEKFTVAVYDHGGSDEKWHKWLAMELTKAMPDVYFLFYGNKNAIGQSKNTEWVGRMDIKDIIKRSSCLLRLTVHDGYPVAPIEFMYSGRKVITNVKDMPFTNYVKLGEIREDRVVEIKKMVHDEIRKVKKSTRFGKDYKDLIKYYDDLLNPVKFKKRIENEIKRKSPKNKRVPAGSKL